MDPNLAREKLIDYLYGELPPPEKAAFEEHLRSDLELSEELQSFQNLRQICRLHLEDYPVPRKLRAKMTARLGIKRPWWGGVLGQGFFRPAMVGAFTVLLTLGIAYQFRDRSPASPQLAQKPPAPAALPTGELSQRDFLTAAQASRTPLPRPSWRSPQPTLGSGLVSLASYGSPSMPQAYGETTSYDIRQMEQDADWGIAQFTHQRAMRMRVMGDCRGAAQQLAQLIKKYPAYPHVFDAAAQRIDCLFRIGENKVARQELAWLHQQSPFLAQMVSQRWGL